MSLQKVCPRCGEQYDASIAFCAKDGTRTIALGQTADLIGTVIAERYRITSRLGEGGMGQVFLAEHVRMKRRSAIKIMRPALVGDGEALQRFSREAENASQISHPNVASIFDFGETSDGLVYLAMEFVAGEPLSDKLMREIALHPDMASDIIGQAADGLQAAHDLGILHRDLKPDNIMLGKRPDGTFLVKLVDFGIARTMDTNTQKVTRTGFAVGTPEFMSPEQLAGDTLDARSDQYSLALVAFIALTGKDAFPANTSKESLIARLTTRPQTLQEAKQDVAWPVELQRVFDKALSPEAADRYESVSAFAGELGEAISSMSPSQTAELYRFALRQRLASVAQRTPPSDLDRIRTPASPVPTAERLIAQMQAAEASAARPTDESRIPVGRGAADLRNATSDADSIPRVKKPSSPKRAMMIGGAVAAVAIGAWVATRGGEATPASVRPDSSATASVPPADAANGTVPVATPTTTAPTAATPNRVVPPAVTASGATAAKPGATSATVDTAVRNKQIRDSVRTANKAKADSVARVAARRNSGYPDSAIKAALEGAAPQWRAFISKENDIRVLAMSPVQVAWRSQQGAMWQARNVRTETSTPFEMVDPIERWRSWRDIVRTRRPVIVIEVAPERASFPNFTPANAVDLKKGNVKSVDVKRDGVNVETADTERFQAFVNVDEQTRAKKAMLSQVALSVNQDVFAPRPDGAPPRIELVIIDEDRRDAIHIFLSDFVVRQMWTDMAPYRAALVKK